MATNQMDRANTVAKDSLKNMPHAAQSVVEDAREMAEQGKHFFDENFDSVRKSATRYYKTSENLIRENPFYAIAGGIAIGAIIGALLARPRH